MKLNFAITSAVLTIFAAAPAFADFDLPAAGSVEPSFASSVSNLSSQSAGQPIYSDVTGPAASGFDLNGLNSFGGNATAYGADNLQQTPEYIANTTKQTGIQAVFALPDCRTSTLSAITDPTNADSLPSCTLGSLSSMSVVNRGQTGIYGEAGRFGPQDTTNNEGF
jgi:hypothetical protein